MALKYRVIERQQIACVPLTVSQLVAALRPFTGGVAFSPDHLRRLLSACVEAGLRAETGDEYLAGVEAALRTWLASLGVAPTTSEITAQAVPLPLF